MQECFKMEPKSICSHRIVQLICRWHRTLIHFSLWQMVFSEQNTNKKDLPDFCCKIGSGADPLLFCYWWPSFSFVVLFLPFLKCTFAVVLSISAWQCTGFIIKHHLDRKKLIFWTRFLLRRWKLRSACQGIFVYPKWDCSKTHPSTAYSLACGVLMWIKFVVQAEQECEGDLPCKHGYPHPWAAVMWCLICCPAGCHRVPVKRLMALLMGLNELLAQTRVLYYNKPWFVLHQKLVKKKLWLEESNQNTFLFFCMQ